MLLSSKTVVLLASCAFISACSTGSPTSNEPKNVLFLADRIDADVDNYDVVEFRAQRVVQAGNTSAPTEILEAICDISGEGFIVQITTPAKVKMPLYRGPLRPINVNCTSGDQVAQATFEPQNITTNPKPNPLKGGLIGIAAVQVAAVATKSTRDKAKDRYDFPKSLNVIFDQATPEL